MSTLFWTLLSFLCRAAVSLRYRIKISGLDRLDPKWVERKEGILFLPNHPAHMDPLILFLYLWPKYRMRPLVVEYIFRLPILRLLMKLVRALPIPNFDTSVNQLKVKKAQDSIQKIAEGLKKGENFALYPAGRLKNTGKEILGGSSAAHALIQECPSAHIVLVRTTGLWGSSFSRALLGRSPDLTSTLWHGLKAILKNLIFFTPRRDVYVEIETEPSDLPRGASRVELNRYLENWYNRYVDEAGKVHEAEPIKLVSYSVWREELPEVFVPKKKRGAEGGDVSVSSATSDKIYAEIRRILDNPSLEIRPEMSLPLDLGMDSLNIAEMIAFLAANYDVGDLHPEDLETVQSVLEIAEGARVAGGPSMHQVVHVTWPEEKDRLPPEPPVGRTIPEAFLEVCERMGSASACGDDLVGVLNYKKMKRSVLVLAEHFRKMPDEKIAVLLPASAGAFIVILALQSAGKVPVMLNWTLGPRYLDEMMNLSGATAVLSSWRFMERLSHVEFGSLLDKIQLLEDVRQDLKLATKLKGAFLSFCSVSFVLRALKIQNLDENSPAVILFTSGTEASPKGVPLSHKNILSNQHSALQCIGLIKSDVMYGILPPFHSFGFSVAGLFPLLAGVRAAFYPDPTDSFALAEGIERWKITLFCAAPSFLKGLFQAAKKEQLRTVRFFVTGAEKAQPELFERVRKLGTNAKLIEGYGITECAPILTISNPDLPPKGVGQLMPGVELCTVHPETLEPLAQGAEGEICVRGPNVFNGYLGNPRSPFLEIAGKRWYRTGDLGRLEPDGTLILSGRLKRFTKLGGEMISLGAIEEALNAELLKRGQISADEPSLAVCSEEKVPGKVQLTLFATFPINKETANEILIQSGFSRLIRISAVKQVEEIPLLGTGKTDYRKLQSMIV